MKNLIFILLTCLMFACIDTASTTEDCDTYQDLCGDGTNIEYQICADSNGSAWYEVNGHTYYTVDYMFSMECD